MSIIIQDMYNSFIIYIGKTIDIIVNYNKFIAEKEVLNIILFNKDIIL